MAALQLSITGKYRLHICADYAVCRVPRLNQFLCGQKNLTDWKTLSEMVNPRLTMDGSG